MRSEIGLLITFILANGNLDSHVLDIKTLSNFVSDGFSLILLQVKNLSAIGKSIIASS